MWYIDSFSNQINLKSTKLICFHIKILLLQAAIQKIYFLSEQSPQRSLSLDIDIFSKRIDGNQNNPKYPFAKFGHHQMQTQMLITISKKLFFLNNPEIASISLYCCCCFWWNWTNNKPS